MAFSDMRRLFVCAALLGAAPAQAQNTPGYELVSRSNGVVEVRFHNMPINAVHTDMAQNTLAVDFQGPVDDATFEKLGTDFPEWVALAYAGYDTGVIRASRPVTFLTHTEADGFSLRLVPRGAPPERQDLRGQLDNIPTTPSLRADD